MCVAAENRLPGQADVDRKDGVNVGWSAPTEHDRPVQRAREASPPQGRAGRSTDAGSARAASCLRRPRQWCASTLGLSLRALP
jgi:hypothetical protein